MKHRLVILLIASLALWACNRDNSVHMEPTPTADLVLRQMSNRLAHATQITFKIKREFQTSANEGELDDVKTGIDVAIHRPDKLMVGSEGAEQARGIYSDGRNFSVVDQKMKLYASVPANGDIDDLVARIDARYGFTPPLVEFMLNDPYKKISTQIQNSSYKGTEVIDGVQCHHLAAEGEFANAELWVGVTDQLPRRLVAIFKQREGAPRLTADFFDWNLSAAIEDRVFSFVPAAEDEKIEMLPMEALKDDPRLMKKTDGNK